MAPITTINQLLTRDGEGLKALYQRSKPGTIPVGESEGMASVAPGTDEGEESRRFFSFLWQGKVFERADEGTTTLVNKTFLGKSFAAKVYVGASLLDGKDSIIIDYKDTPFKPFRIIRDEIREVAPGIYLGYAYLRGIDYAPIVFALNFNEAPDRPLPRPMP
ncbi:MAG: hypothetical protein ACHQ49_05255 [Elusimicrobiota bacterium]